MDFNLLAQTDVDPDENREHTDPLEMTGAFLDRLEQIVTTVPDFFANPVFDCILRGWLSYLDTVKEVGDDKNSYWERAMYPMVNELPGEDLESCFQIKILPYHYDRALFNEVFFKEVILKQNVITIKKNEGGPISFSEPNVDVLDIYYRWGKGLTEYHDLFLDLPNFFLMGLILKALQEFFVTNTYAVNEESFTVKLVDSAGTVVEIQVLFEQYKMQHGIMVADLMEKGFTLEQCRNMVR